MFMHAGLPIRRPSVRLSISTCLPGRRRDLVADLDAQARNQSWIRRHFHPARVRPASPSRPGRPRLLAVNRRGPTILTRWLRR